MEIVFSVRSERSKETIAPHTHNCHEIVFYAQGCSGETVIDGCCYQFHPGCISVNPAGVNHSEVHTGRGNVYFFGFLGDLDIGSCVCEDMWNLQSSFKDILRETRNQEYCYQDITDCKIREIIAHIKRKNTVQNHGVRDLIYCKKYMDENYMHGISMETLGKMCGYSPDYFRHLFVKKFNISPQRYIVSKRLEYAASLLRGTEMKCTDIAYVSGFSDNGQLTKMFSAAYGITPLKYRKTFKNQLCKDSIR